MSTVKSQTFKKNEINDTLANLENTEELPDKQNPWGVLNYGQKGVIVLSYCSPSYLLGKIKVSPLVNGRQQQI